MDGLLINPPAIRLGGEPYIAGLRRILTPSQYNSMPVEHLGFMSIKASARSAGFDIQCVNGILLQHSSIDQTLAKTAELINSCGEPTVFGVSLLAYYEEFCTLTRELKRRWPRVHIIAGNSFAALNAELVLENVPEVDFVCTGDGELVVPGLISALRGFSTLASVPGLAYRGRVGGSVGGVEQILDDYPWADRDELSTARMLGFAAAVSTSRGCPYRCTFCGTAAISARLGRASVRLREVDDVVNEIEYLTKYHGVDFITITDDLFLTKHPASRERAIMFAQRLIKRNLSVRLMIDIRVDSFDKDVFRLLAKAGLARVFVGIESGDLGRLVLYGKHYGAKGGAIGAVLEQLAEIGIEVVPGIIMFHSDVTAQEILSTLELVDLTAYQSKGILTSREVVYSGTELHRQLASRNLLSSVWPVGEWEFADHRMGQMYVELTRFISTRNSTYEEARAWLVSACMEQVIATERRQED